MIRRLYVHNFRCLENFELLLREPSSLLIGKNGSGKTTVSQALEILQKIARGTNRVRELVKPADFTRQHIGVPVRIEIEIEIKAEIYEYAISFELPEGSKELRVLDEKLLVNGKPIYTRQLAEVHLAGVGRQPEGSFRIDWHLVAWPVVQEQTETDPLFIFKQRLARILILRPVPALITGDSEGETPWPNDKVTDLGAWLSNLLGYAPGSYGVMEKYLRQVMPDLLDIKNERVGRDTKSIRVQFSREQGTLSLPFNALSDGEKCYLICATAIAANDGYGPQICFWDEPDNYLAMEEVGDFILALRTAFESGGQFIATSHNPEAVRRFSNENTFLLYRKSHLEPTIIRRLEDLNIKGDLIGALLRGDVEPLV